MKYWKIYPRIVENFIRILKQRSELSNVEVLVENKYRNWFLCRTLLFKSIPDNFVKVSTTRFLQKTPGDCFLYLSNWYQLNRQVIYFKKTLCLTAFLKWANLESFIFLWKYSVGHRLWIILWKVNTLGAISTEANTFFENNKLKNIAVIYIFGIIFQSSFSRKVRMYSWK